mmetsp:Transcript_44274/g.125356  ORF Transcript_44274/g.125356 Transcript_44274/m.125356 type:complete len:263 (+) Transcript_44274:872-1660(+)
MRPASVNVALKCPFHGELLRESPFGGTSAFSTGGGTGPTMQLSSARVIITGGVTTNGRDTKLCLLRNDGRVAHMLVATPATLRASARTRSVGCAGGRGRPPGRPRPLAAMASSIRTLGTRCGGRARGSANLTSPDVPTFEFGGVTKSLEAACGSKGCSDEWMLPAMPIEVLASGMGRCAAADGCLMSTSGTSSGAACAITSSPSASDVFFSAGSEKTKAASTSESNVKVRSLAGPSPNPLPSSWPSPSMAVACTSAPHAPRD